MENFVVSARKYRPMVFNEVIAQGSIIMTLKNAVKTGQLAQSFLFCGPRGVGKTTCARILAKTINCENLNENFEPCGKCAPCLSFVESASFNIHELDAASNNSVDDIRSLVEQVRIPPQVGKFKIYIIDEVHMLSAQAFNSFLKTLEEPPPYAKFILATTEKHKIIPTILSRCQIYDFRRIGIDEIVGHLNWVAKQENVEVEDDALHIIAQKADGAMRDALTIFDQLVLFSNRKLTYQSVTESLNVLSINHYVELTDMVFAGNSSEALLKIDDIFEKGYDGHQFIMGFAEHLRNLLVCKDAPTLQLLEVTENMKEKYQRQAQNCNISCIFKALELISKCDMHYKESTNKRLLIELTILQICYIQQSTNVSNLDNVKHLPQAATNSPQSTVHSPQPKANSPQPNVSTAEKSKETITKPFIPGTNPNVSKKTEPLVNTPVVKENVQASDLVNQPFTKEQLFNYLKVYADKIKTQEHSLFVTLTNSLMNLKEDHIIELTINNVVQEEEIKLKKADLLEYLRKELKNNKIELITVLKKIDEPTVIKPYTTIEKFNKMAEKNPDINILKDKFGLDLNF